MSNPITDSHTVSLSKTSDQSTSSSSSVSPPATPAKTLTVEEMLAADAKKKTTAQPATPVNQPPTAPAALTMQHKLDKLITVKVLDNTSSHFTHEGICTKCGFHSMQLSDAAAREILKGHVTQHWRDVANQQ